MHKLLVTLAVLVGCQMAAMAQSEGAFTDDYRLEFRFSDLKNTEVILGHHMGPDQYSLQEAMINDNGVVVFEGRDTLRYGVYLLYVPDVKYFDFILNEPEIILSTSIEDPVGDMQVIRSQENQLFFEYQNKLAEFRQLNEEAGEDEEQLKKIDDEVIEYIQAVTTGNRDLFTASAIKFLQEIRVPEVKPSGEEADDAWKFSYYYDHYWDNADLTNERFIYTPWLEPKLSRYIQDYTVQYPDRIIKAADRVVAQTGDNREMYRYVVNYITEKYRTSGLMSSETVYVHMVDNYYSADKAWWLNSDALYRMQDRAEVLRPLLLGKRISNESFTDVDGQRRDIINSTADHTLLYFYDMNCRKCLEGIESINEEIGFYKENDIALWGIHIGESPSWKQNLSKLNLSDWVNVEYTGNEEDLIRKYNIESKPTIIVIDENKEIMIRRMGPAQVSRVLRDMLKAE